MNLQTIVTRAQWVRDLAQEYGMPVAYVVSLLPVDDALPYIKQLLKVK